MKDIKTNWIKVTDESSLPKMSTWFVFVNPDSYSSTTPPYLIGQYWGQTIEEFSHIERYIPIPYIYICPICGKTLNRDKDEGVYNPNFGFVCENETCDDGTRISEPANI
jgi:hypothetical protein